MGTKFPGTKSDTPENSNSKDKIEEMKKIENHEKKFLFPNFCGPPCTPVLTLLKQLHVELPTNPHVIRSCKPLILQANYLSSQK